jgi:hypothetical protein
MPDAAMCVCRLRDGNMAPLVTACCQTLANLSVDCDCAHAVFAAALPEAWTTIALLPFLAAHEATMLAMKNCYQHDSHRAREVCNSAIT